MWGLGCGVWGVGCGVWGVGLRVSPRRRSPCSRLTPWLPYPLPPAPGTGPPRKCVDDPSLRSPLRGLLPRRRGSEVASRASHGPASVPTPRCRNARLGADPWCPRRRGATSRALDGPASEGRQACLGADGPATGQEALAPPTAPAKPSPLQTTRRLRTRGPGRKVPTAASTGLSTRCLNSPGSDKPASVPTGPPRDRQARGPP